MKIRALIVLAAPVLALALPSCKVQKERPAEAPQVEVQPGQLPQYEVQTGRVEVHRDTQVIVVPDAEIHTPDDSSLEQQRQR